MFVTPIAVGSRFKVSNAATVIEVLSHELGGDVTYRVASDDPAFTGTRIVMQESEFSIRVLGLAWRPGVVWDPEPLVA